MMMKIRKSTSFWAFCIMFLLLCVLPGSAFAADITVYLTVGAGGELQRAADGSVMAYKPVTVPEGATVQDVIAKAHNDYLGGTEGFAVESDVIKKLWNKTVADTAKNFFIIEVNPNKNLNYSNLMARKAGKNLSDNVLDGYYYFITDSYNGKNKTTAFFAGNGISKNYQFFIADVVVKKGEDFAAVLSACNGSIQKYLENYDIYASKDGGEFAKIDGKPTDNKGNFTINLTETGDYIITAKPQNTTALNIFMRPALHIKVINAEDAPKLENIQIDLTDQFAGENLLGQFDKNINEYIMTVSESQIAGSKSFGLWVKPQITNEVLRQMPQLAWATAAEAGALSSPNTKYFNETEFAYWSITPGMLNKKIFLLNHAVADCAILAEYIINFQYVPVLTNLEFGEGAVMPEAFASETGEYQVSITDENAQAIAITPSIDTDLGANEDYSITINGQNFPAGQATELNLAGLSWNEDDGVPKATVDLVVNKQSEHKNYLSNTYTLNLIKMALTDEPQFAKQPVGAEYIVSSAFRNPTEQPVAELSVFAVATQPVTYQWYCIANDTEAERLVNATEQNYLPSVEQAGDYKYYCVAGYTTGEGEDQQEFYTKSDEVLVTVYNDPTPIVRFKTAIPNMPADKLAYLNEILGSSYQYQKGFYYRAEDTNVTPVELVVTLPDDVQAKNPEISYSWSYSGLTTSGGIYQQFINGIFSPLTDKEYGFRYYIPRVSVKFLDYSFSTDSQDNNLWLSVFVDKKEEIIDPTDWPGNGTEAEPWQLRNAEDIQRLAERVNSGTTYEGKFFKMTADITLPKDYPGMGLAPGGNESKGANLKPFSATFDGGNFTLTYEYGAETPLIRVAREATVKNLNINAPYIKNSAVLGEIYLDYGSDGDYSAGTGGSYQAGTPDTIDISNVTIKSGSNILKSGFIGEGEGSSGANTINITNCKIEKGVNIGYDADKQASAGLNSIGSFAGSISGTINNCWSAATVYGNNSVGGIVGNKSQSMGFFKISNNAFTGKIIATGNYVGGILGAGYNGGGTAPNTPCVTVTNSYVAADISGKDFIGGIVGSEPGTVQSWGNAYIRDNFYYGKITAGADAQSVGSIIGYMNGLNICSIFENNYYLNDCGADKPIGKAKYIDTSAEHGSEPGVIYVNTAVELPTDENGKRITGFDKKDMNRTDDPLGKDKDKLAQPMTAKQFADGTVLNLLNSSASSAKNWVQDEKYPVFDGNKVIPLSLTIDGEYKAEYYIGDELDLSKAVFTLNMSDGSTMKLNLSDIKISGFDTNTRGEQTLTAEYNGLTVEFKVTVLKKPEQNPGNPGVDPNKIRVYFTLMGDSVHGAPTSDKDTHTLKNRNLQTWIARKAYDVDLNATVLDVFEQALTEAGMTWRNPSGNYIEAITGNGVTLAEFSNGNLSGWMYTLNGEHPTKGVSEQFLENNDVIVFHYTDDYTIEKGSDNWGGSSSKPIGGGAAGGESGIVLTPGTVEGADGKNLATMTVKEITKAIENAKGDNVKNIIIEPNIKGSASNVSLSLPIDSLNDMAKEQMNLYMNSRQGSLNLSAAVLQSIAKQAGGIDIRLNVENKELKQDDVKASAANALAQAAANLRGAAESLLANASVTEVTVTSNGKAITSFDGHDLTVYLPVSNRDLFTEGQNYKVVVISSDGTVETIIGKCVKYKAQIMVQVKVNHLSTFIVTNETEKEVVAQPQNGAMNFSDVKENQWFYEAVKFVYEAGLMNGEGENSFNPNGNLNRAMLVTILYRLEQSPEVTTTSKFTDVKAGLWYSEAVIWASENGIVNGYEDNTFKPMNNVSREEMAAMLMRYAKFKQIDVSATKDISGYQDAAQVAEWAKQNMAWSNSAGLIQGDEHNNLNPQGKATRAEAAMILMRLVKNVL